MRPWLGAALPAAARISCVSRRALAAPQQLRYAPRCYYTARCRRRRRTWWLATGLLGSCNRARHARRLHGLPYSAGERSMSALARPRFESTSTAARSRAGRSPPHMPRVQCSCSTPMQASQVMPFPRPLHLAGPTALSSSQASAQPASLPPGRSTPHDGHPCPLPVGLCGCGGSTGPGCHAR